MGGKVRDFVSHNILQMPGWQEHTLPYSKPPPPVKLRRYNKPMPTRKTLVLIDGNALVHRAFHAFARANLTSPSGAPTTAIYGFAVMLINIYTRLKPDYIA